MLEKIDLRSSSTTRRLISFAETNIEKDERTHQVLLHQRRIIEEYRRCKSDLSFPSDPKLEEACLLLRNCEEREGGSRRVSLASLPSLSFPRRRLTKRLLPRPEPVKPRPRPPPQLHQVRQHPQLLRVMHQHHLRDEPPHLHRVRVRSWNREHLRWLMKESRSVRVCWRSEEVVEKSDPREVFRDGGGSEDGDGRGSLTEGVDEGEGDAPDIDCRGTRK